MRNALFRRCDTSEHGGSVQLGNGRAGAQAEVRSLARNCPTRPRQPPSTHSTLFKARQPRVYSTTRIYRRPHTTKGTPIRLRRRNASKPPNETSRAAPRHPKGQRARGPCRSAVGFGVQRLPRINASSTHAEAAPGQPNIRGHQGHLHARARRPAPRGASKKNGPTPT